MSKTRKIHRQDALNYHEQSPPGKIEVVSTKNVSSQADLALAYSPGVAEPCLDIAENPEDVYRYTAKGNLVGVVSNGTAVLGLGNIGPEASKPVMEGKGVLFKKFADIDVFDIELNANDPEEFIKIVKAMEPTFGGINLEDIKAPESFLIEKRLKEEMNIPVMHDDQHGTAIISASALLNALQIVNKKIEEVQVVVNGAGAAAISCAKLYLSLGLKKENLLMLDSKGVINNKRENLDESKAFFATKKKIDSLEEAMVGADVFLGLSVADIVTKEMILSMAGDPIVFALANPDPEISYELAMSVRDDIIMATGRSDHPNQVNNVLGFPFIFRGALDIRATSINEEMKLAAVHALADLAKQPVPEAVGRAYADRLLGFGKGYIIPKPLDPRLITTVAPEVAKAAMKSGVAKKHIEDWDAYEEELQARVGGNDKLINAIITRAKKRPKHVVFAEADNYKILKAAQTFYEEGMGEPILLGNKKHIYSICEKYNLDVPEYPIIDAFKETRKGKEFAEILHERRKRKGLTYQDCVKLMRDRNYFGGMMVDQGEADAVISGLTKDYSTTLKPALHTIGLLDEGKKVAGMMILMTKKGVFFFADTTVQVDPDVKDLVDIIGITADTVRFFNEVPRVAVLSYSNFGSIRGEVPNKAAEVARIARERYPDLKIEGDIQANVSINSELQKELYPFSHLAETGANTLIFPNLASGNIAYKLLMELGGSQSLGPVLLGLKKPFHVLQIGSSIREIVNMAAVAVNHATVAEQRSNQNEEL